MTGYKLGTSAPTQINLPHNSFVRPPPKRDTAADAMRERYKSLRDACRSGDSNTIRKLVEGGCDVNHAKLDNYEFTPLHHAAWKGKTDAVTMLLALGARPDPTNRDLKTPLHLAASNGKASTVRALVRRGAKLSMEDAEGNTPLDVATKWCNNETMPALKQAEYERDRGTRYRVERANAAGASKRFTEGHVPVERVGVYPCTEAWR